MPTTHGCAGALIDDGGLVLPVLDYEFAGVERSTTIYARFVRPIGNAVAANCPSDSTGAADRLAKAEVPEAFARAKYYLTYPQYWAWRLPGVAASEVTHLGCHSDLWRRLRAPFKPGGQARPAAPDAAVSPRLGSARPGQARGRRPTGLDPETGVLCGVHDSNASLLPHLASRKPPFTIVSTGTWVILMAPGLGVDGLEEADDMLANVDVEGGRSPARASWAGANTANRRRGAATRTPRAGRVIESGAMALPCFAQQGGPFASRKGEIRGDVASGDRPALATLYIALMTDLMLTRLGADAGDMIVEGSFAANSAYCGLLAALRPSQRVFGGGDSAGTARGAALLARWPAPRPEIAQERPIEPSSIEGLAAYRTAWNSAVQ